MTCYGQFETPTRRRVSVAAWLIHSWGSVSLLLHDMTAVAKANSRVRVVGGAIVIIVDILPTFLNY